MLKKRNISNFIRTSFAIGAVAAIVTGNAITGMATGDDIGENGQTGIIGGGYAISGQIDYEGYAAKVYDATTGLPTSDANFILGSSDGYVWIGGYSGIFRYDGTVFER